MDKFNNKSEDHSSNQLGAGTRGVAECGLSHPNATIVILNLTLYSSQTGNTHFFAFPINMFVFTYFLKVKLTRLRIYCTIYKYLQYNILYLVKAISSHELLDHLSMCY